MGYFVGQSLSVILISMLCNRRQETAAPSPNQARRSPATMFSLFRCSMGRLMGIEMVVFLGIMMMMVMMARRLPATILSLFRCSIRNLMIIRMFKMMLNKNSDGDGVHGHDGRMSQHFALQ